LFVLRRARGGHLRGAGGVLDVALGGRLRRGLHAALHDEPQAFRGVRQRDVCVYLRLALAYTTLEERDVAANLQRASSRVVGAIRIAEEIVERARVGLHAPRQNVVRPVEQSFAERR